MRIGIDHHLGLTHAPGTGRYVRELTRGLTEIEGDFGLRLFDCGRNPRVEGLERADLAPVGTPHVDRNLRLALPRRAIVPLARIGLAPDRLLGGVDWFHSANPLGVRFSRARASCVVGELPTDLGAADDRSRRIVSSFRSIDLVFVFSTLAREVVKERLSVPPERIAVVPVGADHWARKVDRSRASPRASPPHLIVLGMQRREREPLALLRALEALAERGVEFRVSFLGRQEAADREFLSALASSPIAQRIVLRSPSEFEMPRLVDEASALIHLDRGALTPVTPLEALAVGCPVVVSESPVFREALESHATYVTTEIVAERDAFSRIIEGVLLSSEKGSATEARRRFAVRYTWAASAEAHVVAWRNRV